MLCKTGPSFGLIIGFNNCVGEGGGRDIGEKARGGRFRGKQEREVGGKKRGGGGRSGENWDKVPNPVRIILKSRSPV